ncbi:hypothetical protein [Roseomonas sp. E05]|uniref:hypothetical protein n=1 Tax=Roseomonas sp. E05 TaxID=3046310 RepID=UPI0032D908CF
MSYERAARILAELDEAERQAGTGERPAGWCWCSNPLNPGDREAFHAVFLGQGGPLPSRIRVLLDFLAEEGRGS